MGSLCSTILYVFILKVGFVFILEFGFVFILSI